MKRTILIFTTSIVLGLVILFGGACLAFPERASDIGQKAMITASKPVNEVALLAENMSQSALSLFHSGKQAVSDTADSASTSIGTAIDFTTMTADNTITAVGASINTVIGSAQSGISNIANNVSNTAENTANSIEKKWNGAKIIIGQTAKNVFQANRNITVSAANTPDSIMVASLEDAEGLASIAPGSGDSAEIKEQPPQIKYEYEAEEDNITSEVVLVPREKTVISSSRDGKIKSIHFANGDKFYKGDVLLEYECTDIRAEIDAAGFEHKLARQKTLTTSRLYDLSIASKIESEQAVVEKQVARAKQTIAQSKLDACTIRAQFDGRVVKRLANPNEYTRTDRVLMEIASTGTLDAEFLMPSIWLRWINIDAPITLSIYETGKEYTGKISRIYGEVDPVSQSIQIRATLDDYNAPLLPGMSGQVGLDVNDIRDAGIMGFLETTNGQ